MFCPKCGNKIEDGVRFCVYCGYEIEEDKSAKKTNMNYYEILEITSDASPEVIKAAYKALVKKLHPDNGGERDYMGRTIEEVNLAYDTLSNPEKKKIYDDSLIKDKFKFDDDTTENPKYNEKTDNNVDLGDEESFAGLVAGSVAAVIAFFAFKHFDFSTWILVVSGLVGASCIGSLISKLIISGLRKNVNDGLSMNFIDDQEEMFEFCCELLLYEFLFHYLEISNWITKGCLLILIIMIVSILYSFIKLMVEKDR